MMTLAPASRPFIVPFGANVASAVVAGNKTLGSNKRIIAKMTKVKSTLPAVLSLNGVCSCGIKGPVPII